MRQETKALFRIITFQFKFASTLNYQTFAEAFSEFAKTSFSFGGMKQIEFKFPFISLFQQTIKKAA
jgi:hypothetical protein